MLAAQDQQLQVPERQSKVQQLVDVVLLHAQRLRTDPMVRAGVRLSLDQRAKGLDRSGPFLRWQQIVETILDKAAAQGELLPHVRPGESAEVLVGAFAGVQAMSETVSGYGDLPDRISALLRHLLPSVVLASVLAAVDLSPGRGAVVFDELNESRAE